MKKTLVITVIFVGILGAAVTSARAQEALNGDTRLACEAILCLSSSTRPSECTPSLSRYFGIRKWKFSDTIRSRLNFLNQCPVSNQTPGMQSLVSAMSQGAGQCDVAALNVQLRIRRNWEEVTFISSQLPDYCAAYIRPDETTEITYISDQLPNYCAAYMDHDYTSFESTRPRYVGTPGRKGYWVEASQYDRALAEYSARLMEEEEMCGQNSFNKGTEQCLVLTCRLSLMNALSVPSWPR